MERNHERPRPGALEQRTADATADGRRIRGLIPYGVESRDMGGWREVVEATAFRHTKVDELRCVIDHAGIPLGRFPKTLELEDRSDGLHWSVDPPQSRQDVVEAVQRAGSWRMVVERDRWEGDVRHVEAIAELRDVTLVGASEPAYPAAAVEYRSSNEVPPREAAERQGDMPEQAEEKVEVEERTVELPPAGSLRVEERAEVVVGQTLAALYEQRGYFEHNFAAVSWDEFRSFTWSAGTVLTDLNPLRRDGVPFGYDRRWLYPVVPTTAVSAATTSIPYLRQSARTVAGTAVIRPLDSVTTKPETSTTAELQTLQLDQVASVQSGIPRIHAAQPLFQSPVESDLRLSINDGLDEIVRRGVATAGTSAAVTGDILEKTRRAMTVVQAQGYAVDTLAIDPAGAESLDLLRSSGSEQFYLYGPGQGAPSGPFGLQLRVWKSPGTAVLDSGAFGRLYVAPVELRSFEADGGLTNKQNVRMETNAGYAVERVAAGLRIV